MIEDLPSDAPLRKSTNFDVVYQQAEGSRQGFKELLDLGKGLEQELGADVLAEDDLHAFEAKAKTVAPDVGEATVVIPPIKDKGTARDKLGRKDYGGDGAARLTDLNRASVVVGHPAQIATAFNTFRRLAESQGWTLYDPEDSFSTPYDNGYRDLSVLAVSPSGDVTEIQFHITAMWQAKFAGGGHEMYVQIRELKKIAKTRELTATEAARLQDLEDRSRALYNGAWREAIGGSTP